MTRIELARELRQKVQATENTVAATFDGLKLIADEANPQPLTLPQNVTPNMFYRFDEDGSIYVAVAKGMVTRQNFAKMMERWDS